MTHLNRDALGRALVIPSMGIVKSRHSTRPAGEVAR